MSNRPPASSRSPSLARPTPPELVPFLGYCSSERGLARNTLDAYRRDLTDIYYWLIGPDGVDARIGPARNPVAATPASPISSSSVRMGDPGVAATDVLARATADQFRQYLQSQSRKKQSTKTVARRLAAIRVYLKFLEVMGQDKQDILQQLERPKPERDLPKILNIEQVARLINAPDPDDTKFYHRDIAILELLYAAGLRASELCTMSVRDANLQVGAVRLFGKGSKERIVPIGKACINAIATYLVDGRPRLLEIKTRSRGGGNRVRMKASRGRRTGSHPWPWRIPTTTSDCSCPDRANRSTGSASGCSSSATRKRSSYSRKSAPTSCATASPATSSAGAPTSASSRNCSATPTSPPPKFTPTSTPHDSEKSTNSSTRGDRLTT